MKNGLVLFSVLLFPLSFLSYSYGQILDKQTDPTLDLIDSVIKKIGKLIDASTSCNNIALTTGSFPEYCIRFQLTANTHLSEIFNDNQTKQDIDKILYG